MHSSHSRTAPPPSSLQAQVRMRNTKQRDTVIEKSLRSELHGRKLRFRLHHRLPGFRSIIDIAFPTAKVAVFVDGCFWHSCPKHKTIPKANRRWWSEKLRSNRIRDRKTSRLLLKSGWVVLRVWEHEATARMSDRILTPGNLALKTQRRQLAQLNIVVV
jgi:DNA mismatch endonuclease (patch repair protein)